MLELVLHWHVGRSRFIDGICPFENVKVDDRPEDADAFTAVLIIVLSC